MLVFVIRRTVATLLVLLVASFIVYVLTAYAGDPLRELRGSIDESAQTRMAYLTELLQLEVPPALRYFSWLGGAAGCLIGQCDLGVAFSRGEQEVTAAIATAASSTLQLVVIATILAIVIGVAVGMTTALRQYSGYDYTVTFLTFVFYSLPVFWVAVLLKEFGAIRFNYFLRNPNLTVGAIAIIAIVVGFLSAAMVGGRLAVRIRTFLIAGAATAALFTLLAITEWFSRPTMGIVGVLLMSVATAAVVLLVSTGLRHRRAVISAGVMVALVLALWYPLQFPFFYLSAQWWLLPATAIVLTGAGALIGRLLGQDDWRTVAKSTALIGALLTLPLMFDQMFLRWDEYLQRVPLSGGFISTIGASTPALARTDDQFLHLLDSLSHMVLPTAALMIVSLAAYTRYSRASLLEVLNHDYVRTARAKGLSERTVIMRHAFRNAMIPIATIVAIDFGAVIGGAIITERVFAWQGMGALFNQALNHVDVNLMMGFFLVTGVLAVVFNIVADLVYSALDPRIRVS